MFGRAGQQIIDGELGELRRQRGMWRGRIALVGDQSVPLALPGGRHEPDAPALAIARSITSGFSRWRPAIEHALRDHASDGGETADGVESLMPSYVAVVSVDRVLTVELGYRVPWDDDHMLGARVRDDRLVELNGSVLEP